MDTEDWGSSARLTLPVARRVAGEAAEAQSSRFICCAVTV